MIFIGTRATVWAIWGMRFRPARDDDDGDGSTDGPHSDGGFDLADVGGPGGDPGVGDFRGVGFLGQPSFVSPTGVKGLAYYASISSRCGSDSHEGHETLDSRSHFGLRTHV